MLPVWAVLDKGVVQKDRVELLDYVVSLSSPGETRTVLPRLLTNSKENASLFYSVKKR